ncbi:thiol-disulfide oxidoreductase DCC family protein [Yoonia sp. 208BN28-4]|uniref:thiol-disulfide oxidoreductase DCC family protein n=1 Tax=Yoonia sp. 208BN28-4 TaxID=3126505 RepID=UPI00309F5823
MTQDTKTSVLYNADCPVCNFEISHYAQYADKNGLPIRFDDLNSDARQRWNIDADTAARRLYVLHEGELASGIDGFLILWAQMPKYRWLGKIVGLPVFKQIAAFLYDYIAAPLIYRWHLRRQRKAAA